VPQYLNKHGQNPASIGDSCEHLQDAEGHGVFERLVSQRHRVRDPPCQFHVQQRLLLHQRAGDGHIVFQRGQRGIAKRQNARQERIEELHADSCKAFLEQRHRSPAEPRRVGGQQFAQHGPHP